LVENKVLVEFQQALADLVAAPDFCREIRANPSQLRRRYDLSELEYERLVAMVNQPAMACNCMLYRANRLAPLALNLYDFCKALGPRLGPLLSEYSIRYPNTKVHFYLECDRFCRFMLDKISQGYELEPRVKATLDRECAKIRLELTATYTVL
jgi:hypothetical protein